MKKLYYKICRLIARLIFHKRKVVYEHIPEDNEPAVYVCNHSGAIGPVNMTLYFDRPARPWIVSYIFDKEIAPNFVFHDFFFARGKKCKFFWRGLARVVAFFLRPLLEMQNAISVYKINARARHTFKNTIDALKSGENIIIFPECPTKYSKYICELYDGFIQMGKYYYDQTGKLLKFYPVYVPPQLKTINVGEPISYDVGVSAEENRHKIAEYLKLEIDKIAKSLPKHKAIPFLTEDYYENYGEFVNNPDDYWKFVACKKSE